MSTKPQIGEPLGIVKPTFKKTCAFGRGRVLSACCFFSGTLPVKLNIMLGIAISATFGLVHCFFY